MEDTDLGPPAGSDCRPCCSSVADSVKKGGGSGAAVGGFDVAKAFRWRGWRGRCFRFFFLWRRRSFSLLNAGASLERGDAWPA